jgi:hypothetical protein
MGYFVLKRPPFTGDPLYGLGLHQSMGAAKHPAQATPPKIIVKPYAGKPAHTVGKGVYGNGSAAIAETAP